MAIRINCPACKAVNMIDEKNRGRKFRCGKCNELISVPNEEPAQKKRAEEEAIQENRKVKVKTAATRNQDDEDSRPARKKSKAAPSAFPVLLLVGGGLAVVLFMILGVGGIGALFYFRSGANQDDAKVAKNVAKADPLPDDLEKKVDANKKANPDPTEKPDPKPVVDPNAGKPLPDQMAPALVERVMQATVYLRVTMPSGQVAEGSGFFAVEPGIIITNAHVLGMLQSKSKVPTNVQVVVNSGETNEIKMVGQVLGVDRGSDLAVVRVNEPNLPTPLVLEGERPLVQTQKVYIFGFPFGEQLGKNITVSESSVSSLRKKAGVLNEIQVNGGMHPGNSGGPVVNSLGNLIGVSVAGIKGTQINFAVPADFVRMMMEGKLAETKHGEAFVQGAETRLPIQLTCLDPLKRIREMRVEVWTGMPGQERPHSAKKPEPMAGDGPRQSFSVNYQNSSGSADVSLPQLPPGHVYWLQPVVTTVKGSTQWGAAIATSSSIAPVERSPGNLLVSLTAQAERTVKLKSSSSVTLLKGKEKKLYADNIYAEMLEVLSPDPKGALMRTGIGKASVKADEDGRPVRMDPQIPSVLRAIPPVFVIDATNKLRERSDRSLGAQMSLSLREQTLDAYSQICNSLEAVTLPMPNRMIQPRETWQTQVPMLLRTGKKPELVDLALSCTFEGTRTRDQRSEGVISVAGQVKGRDANANKIGGEVTGKIAFDVTGGFIAQAQLTIVSEYELAGGDLQMVYAFDIDLNRVPGNTEKIVMPVVNKTDPGPLAKGRILLNQNGVLAPNDPPDLSVHGRRVNARMKLHPIAMEAGKTYIISLNSGSFDSFLRLSDPTGKVVAEDDDGAGFPHARIVFRASQAGNHTIQATSFDGKIGPYQLTVHESDASPSIPKVGNAPPKIGGANTPSGPGENKAPVPAGGLAHPAPNRFFTGDVDLRHLTFNYPKGGKIVGDLVWAKDGKSFFMLYESGMIQRVSLATGHAEQFTEIGSPCGNLAMSGEGLLVSVTGKQEVWVLAPETLSNVKKKIAVPEASRVTAGVNSSIAFAGTSSRSVHEGISVIDLKEGRIVKTFPSIPTRGMNATPDGKFLFVEGGIEQLKRYRAEGAGLIEEESGYRIAANGQRICFSPDSKWVCLCAGGGNGKGHPDHPPVGAYSVFIYPVEKLKQPITGITSGAYPRTVGIDPKSGYIFTQNHGTPLILYGFAGDSKVFENQCLPIKGSDVQEFSVSPLGSEVLIRTESSLVHVKINKTAPPPVTSN